MPSDILARLYRGDRPGAHALACELPLLDLHEAAALGALEALIERTEENPGAVAWPSDDGYLPLHLAAYFGNTACVKELLRRGAMVDARSANGIGATALHSACMAGHAMTALALLAGGADPRAVQRDGATPLMLAQRSGAGDVIALISSVDTTARSAGAGSAEKS